MGMREVRRSWAQFLAIFLIGAIAVTLFVGLLSNAATFEYQTERAYEAGNCADIFLTSARHEEEEEEAIRTILGDKGELDGRYEFFGTANGKNAYLAVHDGMPRIGKPYSLSTGEIHTEDYYCLVDESLILGRVDTGLYEVGDPLLFEVPLSAYLGQLSDIQLDWAAIGEEAEAVLEENPRLALILQLMGLDLDEILASLESLIGSEVDLEEALSFLDSYVKEGGTNLLREDSLILPLVVTGSMKHPENIQLSSYQMTTILASDRMLKEAFQSVLEQNYQGIGLELARFGAAILLGWNSASLLPDSASPLALPNQYLITVEDDADIPELKRELHEYFKDDVNVLSISERPVRGSTSSGNSVNISTTSLARSPQAAMTITSASPCLAMACWSTVLPHPNGPGINPVPPSAIGLKVSMHLTPVSITRQGRGFSLYALMATFTGHFCIMDTLCSSPDSSVRTATVSFARYVPVGTTDLTL